MQAERKLTGYPSVDKPWLKYYAQEEVEEIPHRKIYTHLWECNRNHLHDTALLYYGRKITFSELFAQVDTVARALMGLGVKSGDICTYDPQRNRYYAHCQQQSLPERISVAK